MLVGPQPKLNAGAYTGSETSQLTTTAAFTQATGLTPTALYTFLDASGTLVDVVGGNNLTTVTGTPKYREDVGGDVGIDYSTGTNCGHSADVNDFALQNVIIGFVGVWESQGPAGANPGIGGRCSSATLPIASIYKAGDTAHWPTFWLKGATTGNLLLSDTTVNIFSPKRPLLYIGQIDRTNTTARLVVAESNKIITNLNGSIAAHDTFSGGVSKQFFVGGGTGIFLKSGFSCSLAFFITGAQCSGSTVPVTLAKRLGFGGI